MEAIQLHCAKFRIAGARPGNAGLLVEDDEAGHLLPVRQLPSFPIVRQAMKVGIVGAGNVGRACALALVARGCAREVVLVDRTRARAEAVATDIRYGLPLLPRAEISAVDYDGLAGSALVMITAGVNEKTGGATDRSDPQGRLRLLDQNAEIYRDLVPRVVGSAPQAVILVVTDPPRSACR